MYFDEGPKLHRRAKRNGVYKQITPLTFGRPALSCEVPRLSKAVAI